MQITISKTGLVLTFPKPGDPAALALLAESYGIAPSGLEYILHYGAKKSLNDSVAAADVTGDAANEVARKRFDRIISGGIESGKRGPAGDTLANAIVAAAMVWFGAQRVRNAAKRVKANGLNAVLSESVAAALAGLDGVPVASIPADRIARAVAKKMGEFESAAKDAIARKAAMAKLDLE